MYIHSTHNLANVSLLAVYGEQSNSLEVKFARLKEVKSHSKGTLSQLSHVGGVISNQTPKRLKTAPFGMDLSFPPAV